MAFYLNVGVQIFLCVSGFLYGQKEISDIKGFYISRAKRILIPNAILSITIYCIYVFVFKTVYPIPLFIKILLGLGSFTGLVPMLSHTWFISYILLCYLITPLLQIIFKKEKHQFKKLIIFLAICQILYSTRILPTVDAALVAAYVMGYFYAKCCKTKKKKIVFEITSVILMFLILPIKMITRYNLFDNIPEILKTNAPIINSWSHTFLGITIFIFLYKILSKKNIQENKFLNLSDKYSYHIYLVHQIFILYNLSVLSLTPIIWVNIIIALLLTVIFGIILYTISEPFCRKRKVENTKNCSCRCNNK